MIAKRMDRQTDTPWFIGLSRQNLYLFKMQMSRPQARLTGSESLGWGPGIRILTDFPHNSDILKLWA